MKAVVAAAVVAEEVPMTAEVAVEAGVWEGEEIVVAEAAVAVGLALVVAVAASVCQLRSLGALLQSRRSGSSQH